MGREHNGRLTDNEWDSSLGRREHSRSLSVDNIDPTPVTNTLSGVTLLYSILRSGLGRRNQRFQRFVVDDTDTWVYAQTTFTVLASRRGLSWQAVNEERRF
ncbi:hypothetical protein PM082_008522 [Marasmius tenuissimus]|nr:hypothetical protein PM082_008522 [Marasmius tenuissimus]